MSACRWDWLAPWRRLSLLAGLLACGLLVMAAAASAATFTVNDSTDAALSTPSDTACVSTDGGGCTLRAAVQAADNTGGASTIMLPAGDDKLTIAATTGDDPSNGDLDINNTAQVTITGAGSGSTTVDANQIDRAFAVQTGAGLSLSGMTIENGSPSSHSTGSQYGGAIYSDGALALTGDVTLTRNNALTSEYGGAIYAGDDPASSLSVAGVTSNRNSAYYGGAIYDDAPGTASITASTFTNNLASDDYGGAIYGANGALTINSSQFSHNDAEYGGGIYWDSGAAVTVTNSSFTANSTSYYGGALYDDASTSTTLTNDRFIDNAGGEYGGALYLDSSATYTLDQDEFDGNSASYEEGGAVAWEAGSLTSDGSSFVNNTSYYGGALYAESGGGLTLVNATMSNNTSSYGGGIYIDASTPAALTNDTITGNSAYPADGGGIYGPADATLGSGTGVRNTIIAENPGGDCEALFAAATDTGNNLDGDASCFGTLGVAGDIIGVNPLVGDPADNGGPVLTDRLLPGSPAIDAGTSSNCPATDARGVTRPQGATCDLGAFEAAAAGLSLTKAAPASASLANPFDYTLSTTANGPAPATGTTVIDQLPAGMTLYGATASQGSCASAGSPAKLTCDLGTVATGAGATVVLVVADANTGPVTNTATATDDQGARVTASATTQVNAPPSTTPASGTAPSVASIKPSAVAHTSARLNGTVSTGGQPTAYFFQYGKNRSFGQVTPVQHTTTSQNVTTQLKGLAPRTRYQYRLVAINSAGVSYGATMRFKTATWRPRLTLRVKSTHSATVYRYTVTGRLRLPKGVTKTRGCSGTVTVTITQGTHKIAFHRAAVGRGCAYHTTFTATKALASKTKAKAKYHGNHILSATKGKTITLPRT